MLNHSASLKFQNPSLKTVVDSSYGDKNSEHDLLLKGFQKDNSLSSRHQQVYYHPDQRKLLFSVRGTDPKELGDLKTDFLLGLGQLKSTSRFKEAKNTLNKAKEKYKGAEVTSVGHSLGASIVSQLNGADKVVTYNKPKTIGYKNRKNETSIRTKTDVLSFFGQNDKGTKSIKAPLNPLVAHSTKPLSDSFTI